jgi:hypothetical protein
MKKLKVFRGLQVLLAGILIACLIIPIGIAYAETPASVDIAGIGNAVGVGYPFQHHTFMDDGVYWLFYLDSAANRIKSQFSFNGVDWVAGDQNIHYCDASSASKEGGQFDAWWDEGTSTVHFAVVNESVDGSPILYAKYDVVSGLSPTITIDGSWIQAVAGDADEVYYYPTICVNSGHIFLTYGTLEGGEMDVELTMSNSSTVWTPEVGLSLQGEDFPFDDLGDLSEETAYGSVIPLATSTNISIQYVIEEEGTTPYMHTSTVEYNGSVWIQKTDYPIDTNPDWTAFLAYPWCYNAVSVISLWNDNDVAIQQLQGNGSLARVFFNRKGAEDGTPWDATWARNFGEGDTGLTEIVGAMGIRNSDHDLVFTGWDNVGLSETIWSADYNLLAGTWSAVTNVYSDPEVPAISMMASYNRDLGGIGATSFIYGNAGDDLMYGLYGSIPAPVSTDPGTSVIQIVIPLLIAITVVVLALKGIGEVNTVSAIIVLLVATIIGIVMFIVIKSLTLGI